jgi:cell division protein ZapA
VPKTIRIEVYDQSYNVRGDLDEAYVKELARFVDERMRNVAEATRTVDSLRVAVLAALNIADELHSLRQRHAELESGLRQRAERCLTLVEQALKSA